jgi:hypothetical protein
MRMKTNKLTTRQYKPKKKNKEYLRTMHQETKLEGLEEQCKLLTMTTPRKINTKLTTIGKIFTLYFKFKVSP